MTTQAGKCRHRKTSSYPLDPARSGGWYMLVWCEHCGAFRFGAYRGDLSDGGAWNLPRPHRAKTKRRPQ